MPNPEYQREQAPNSYDGFHKIFGVFITLLGSILQTTYQPFKTHYPKAVAFIVTVVIYFSSLLAKLILRSNNRDHVIVNILSLFSGGLAVILPILIIVSTVGWLALGIWVCVFVIVGYRLRDKIIDDFVKIVEDIVGEFRSIMNKLRNGNANGRQGEQNGNANESGNEQNNNANESMDSIAVTISVNESGDEQKVNANESGDSIAVTTPVNESGDEQNGNANVSGDEQNNNANESMDSNNTGE